LRARKTVESAQTAKNAELKALVNSQAEKIIKLETAYADQKREEESITVGYWRPPDKHKTFTESVEREKTELVKTHTTKLAKLRGDLDLETRSYTEYQLNVHRWLHELHETVASSFDEVKPQYLPFLGRGAKIEEMID
jgi:hypothetical protein